MSRRLLCRERISFNQLKELIDFIPALLPLLVFNKERDEPGPPKQAKGRKTKSINWRRLGCLRQIDLIWFVFLPRSGATSQFKSFLIGWGRARQRTKVKKAAIPQINQLNWLVDLLELIAFTYRAASAAWLPVHENQKQFIWLIHYWFHQPFFNQIQVAFVFIHSLFNWLIGLLLVFSLRSIAACRRH